MAYSEDLRSRILQFIATGGCKAEAARRYAINKRTIYRWLNLPADHQAQKPGPRTNRKFDRDRLLIIVQEQPDLMLKEIAAMLGVKNAISRTLIKLGISRKKNTAIRPSIQIPPDH